MNLIATFVEGAARNGARTAIVDGKGRTISFAELSSRSASLAETWHQAGLRSGDRVLLAMPVGIDLYAAIAGLWRVGATIVFPEPALGLSGLRHAVRLTQPRALLTAGIYGLVRVLVPGLWRVGLHLKVRPGGKGDRLAVLGADHPALISFTSGSTGAPKAIVRSHGFLAAQDAALDPLIRPERENEVDLVAFPVFVLANLARGTTSVLPNWTLGRPESTSVETIVALLHAHGVTRALVPPSIAETMAGAPTLPLQTVMTGGGPVFPDLIRRLLHVLPAGADVVSVYGSTEAEPIAWQRASAIATAQWRAMETGSGLLAGRPVAGVNLRLIDDEIVVTGDHVNKTYLGGLGDADNKLNLDGDIWHRTGDAARLDAEGNLWLRGRTAGGAGGRYPFEAEVPARAWPGVRRAALLAIDEGPVLAIEGDAAHRRDWQAAAGALGIDRIAVVSRIPLDQRHHSKVDYRALAARIRQQGSV